MRKCGPSRLCNHGAVTRISSACLRTAKAEDSPQLLRLWDLLSDDGGTTSGQPWKDHAREWFAKYVDDSLNARFPVIEADGELVATAIGHPGDRRPQPSVRPGAHRAPRERHHPARASRPRSRNGARARRGGLGPVDHRQPRRPKRYSRRAAHLREARLHSHLSPWHEALISEVVAAPLLVSRVPSEELHPIRDERDGLRACRSPSRRSAAKGRPTSATPTMTAGHFPLRMARLQVRYPKAGDAPCPEPECRNANWSRPI